MTKTTQHTPTPWAYMLIENKYHEGTHAEGNKTIVTVATVYKGDIAIARCHSVEDAAFIVKACNEYTDLVEGAERACDQRDVISHAYDDLAKEHDTTVAALKLVSDSHAEISSELLTIKRENQELVEFAEMIAKFDGRNITTHIRDIATAILAKV
jgi:hypothetical protein